MPVQLGDSLIIYFKNLLVEECFNSLVRSGRDAKCRRLNDAARPTPSSCLNILKINYLQATATS